VQSAKCEMENGKWKMENKEETKTQRILEFTTKYEVITYATRGMEPYRGFEQFMEAVEKLLEKRPNLQVLIAGEDKVFYRGKLENASYKKLMLEKLNLDMNRVHFVGALDYVEYLKLLQISSAHVYLTVPYVLSWSTLEAMSVGCCLVASNTPPVLEVIKDNYNGLLFDFFNTNQLVEKVEYALDNKTKMQELRKNARKTITDKYSLDLCLSEQIDYIKRNR
jgi:glycosyltransferase involved in cell wall biosynthesis